MGFFVGADVFGSIWISETEGLLGRSSEDAHLLKAEQSRIFADSQSHWNGWDGIMIVYCKASHSETFAY